MAANRSNGSSTRQRSYLAHPAVAIGAAMLLLTVFAIGFAFWPHEDQMRGPTNTPAPEATPTR